MVKFKLWFQFDQSLESSSKSWLKLEDFDRVLKSFFDVRGSITQRFDVLMMSGPYDVLPKDHCSTQRFDVLMMYGPHDVLPKDHCITQRLLCITLN